MEVLPLPAFLHCRIFGRVSATERRCRSIGASRNPIVSKSQISFNEAIQSMEGLESSRVKVVIEGENRIYHNLDVGAQLLPYLTRSSGWWLKTTKAIRRLQGAKGSRVPQKRPSKCSTTDVHRLCPFLNLTSSHLTRGTIAPLWHTYPRWSVTGR